MTHRAPPDITLLQLPKPIPIRTCLIHFPQRNIHKVVAVHEVSIECFTVFELNELLHVENAAVERVGWQIGKEVQ